MRHIFVMQSEMENEVDFEDMQHSADKYSKAFNTHNQRQMKAKKAVIDRKNYRSDSEPYFRPAQRPSAVNSKQKTKPPKTIASEQTDSNLLLDNLIKSNIDAIVGDLKIKEDNVSTLEVSIRTTKLSSVALSSTTPSAILKSSNEQVVDSQSNEKNDTATTVDKVVLDFFSNISSALSSTTPSSLSTPSIVSTVEDKISFTLKNELMGVNSLEKLEQEIEDEALNDLEQVASSAGEIFAESDVLDRNNSKEPQTTTTETQLFQDTVQKEKDPTPVENRRGV